ncbi:MAG: hypothetical protein WC373_07195 [Smithella sp.]
MVKIALTRKTAFPILPTTERKFLSIYAEYEMMAKTAGLTLKDSMQFLPTPQTLLEFKL